MKRIRRALAVAGLLIKPQHFREHFSKLAYQAQAAAMYRPLFRRYQSYTMLHPQTFIHNLQLVEAFRKVEGCVVECGVWRGGCLAAVAEVLGPDRSYHAFDSFTGLPTAKEIDGLGAREWQANLTAPGYHNNCFAPPEFVERALRIAGAGRVYIHAGWFEDTLPKFCPEEPIAILRLDGDWYDSTMTCLRHLFRRVAPGGLVIIDDYYAWDGCARAVHEFLAETKCQARVKQWRDEVAYLVAPSPQEN